jgi:hypothetical protein
MLVVFAVFAGFSVLAGIKGQLPSIAEYSLWSKDHEKH